MKRRAFLVLLTAAALGLFSGAMARAWDGEWFRVCRLNPRGDNYLSLRTCPSTRCREIFQMGPGTRLEALDPYVVRGWRHVKIEPHQPGAGMEGWAFGRYLCHRPPPWE